MRSNRQTRRGLAPLELVLTLPLLLFVMALIINAGTSAAWKVRAHSAARDAVWRIRWPRSGAKPQPGGWPESASVSWQSVGNMARLDHADIDQPVARGATIGQVRVDRDLLDPSRGPRKGDVSIRRERPLLPVLGEMSYEVDHPLLDDLWTYSQTRLSNNWLRRIKVIYDLHENELGEYSSFLNAVSSSENALTRSNLLPLSYRLSAWSGSQRFYDPDYDRLAYSPMGFRPQSPDYHPRLRGFCSLDAEQIYDSNVKSLIDQIKDEPGQADRSLLRTMASGYRQLYQQAISVVEAHLNQLKNSDPPAPQSAISAVEAELNTRKAELEPKIQELDAFIGSL